MSSPSTFFCFIFFFVGLVSFSSAVSSYWLVTGSGQSVKTNSPHYLHFYGSTTGTLAQVYQSQGIPQSTAIVDQAVVATSYTYFAMVEALYLVQMTISSAGIFTAISALTLDLGTAAESFTGTTTSVTIAHSTGKTFTATASPGTLCSTLGISGVTFTISDSGSAITHVSMSIDEYGTGNAAPANTCNFVTSYNSGTKTWTVVAKGYLSASPDPLYLTWMFTSGGSTYWCRIQVTISSYLFSTAKECYKLKTFSATVSGLTSSTATVSDPSNNWENTYTFAITTGSGNC